LKWLLVAILICATTIGDVFRSLGMRQQAGALSGAVTNPYVIISTCSMAVSFFTFMKLVAIAPMSFAVPMSAAAFIPEMLLARWLLKEDVDWRRWTGAGLIAIGVVFISQ
jgi:drug/metabolite transporter (DMT)-like permease